MSTKLLAMGNVLMGDDGIAIYLATDLEEKLHSIGIEVIYGETDIGYSISQIEDEDFVIVMDAAQMGGNMGTVTIFFVEELAAEQRDMTCHNISFIDLLKLYYPKINCIVLTVEIGDVSLRYGLSSIILKELKKIEQGVLEKIYTVMNYMGLV